MIWKTKNKRIINLYENKKNGFDGSSCYFLDVYNHAIQKEISCTIKQGCDYQQGNIILVYEK